MTTTDTPSLRLEIDVYVPREHAFAVFTRQFERFVISWDIDPRWQLEADPDRASGRFGSLVNRS